MKNGNPRRKVDSGMFAALSGIRKANRNQPVLIDPLSLEAAELAKSNVLNFVDIRTCISAACNDVNRFQKPMTLLMVALDHTEDLASKYGKSVADQAITFVMKELAHHKNFLFGTDSAVRIGEYVPGRYLFLLPGFPGSQGTEIAQNLRKAISECRFLSDSTPLKLTVSVGVVYKPGHAGDQDLMILQADKVCAETQLAGGNRVAIGRIGDLRAA